MSIMFDDVAHTYTDTSTGKVIPSVTQIISAVYGTGLENAPSHFVERAAEKGTVIHKEIDTYLTKGTQGETPEFQTWYNWANFGGKNVYCAYLAEHIVYTDTKYGSFAGTVDFFANGFVYDWKTSKTATRKQIAKWQMQLSMYCYALRKMGNIVNEPLKIAHITDTVEVINVDYLGDEFVEETLNKYYEGEKVENRPATDLQTIDKKTVEKFSNAIKQIAVLEKEIEPIREQIKLEMEKRGILALKLGEVNISYVSPTKRKMFDTKRFKADNAEMYEKYIKESEVKSSLRIKVD